MNISSINFGLKNTAVKESVKEAVIPLKNGGNALVQETDKYVQCLYKKEGKILGAVRYNNTEVSSVASIIMKVKEQADEGINVIKEILKSGIC